MIYELNRQKIVGLLPSNAKIPTENLAEAVHLSAPSVTEQVRKLEEQQIIEDMKSFLLFHHYAPF